MKFQTERIIIVALLVVIAYMSLTTCFKKEKQNAVLTDIVKSKTDTARKWQDAAGREHSEKQLVEADIAFLRLAYGRELDSLNKILKIKDSQIEANNSLSTVNTGTIIPKVDTTFDDSLGIAQYPFRYADRWIDVSGIIGKSSSLSYLVRDSLVITTYSKRKNWFSPSITYMDAFSLNPNVKITGLSGFRVPVERPGRLGMGPYIGYGYANGKWSVCGGVSIHYSLIRF